MSQAKALTVQPHSLQVAGRPGYPWKQAPGWAGTRGLPTAIPSLDLPHSLSLHCWPDCWSQGSPLSVCRSWSHPWDLPFSSLLDFLLLLHWSKGCFLATTCVTCMSWSYLTGGWVVWSICGTKTAGFVFSISESLLEKLDGLHNPVYLKQAKTALGPPLFCSWLWSPSMGDTLDAYLQLHVPGMQLFPSPRRWLHTPSHPAPASQCSEESPGKHKTCDIQVTVYGSTHFFLYYGSLLFLLSGESLKRW